MGQVSPLVSYLLLMYNVVLSIVSELLSSLREIKCLSTYIPPLDKILNTPLKTVKAPLTILLLFNNSNLTLDFIDND